MERLSDNEYIKKVLAGESGNFTPLLEKYNKQVFALIVKIVGSREDAEELTQDVFVKAYTSLSKFRGECNFSTWVYRIAYHLAISAIRKKVFDQLSIEESNLSDVWDELHETLLDDSDADQLVDDLNWALEQLSPEERAMIILFYKDNQSMEAIATITGLTQTNVKTKIFRIRKKLLVLIKSREK